jgi:hypothetical protein
VRDAVTLRPLIALRFGRYAPHPDTTFRELFRRPPFTLLEEGEMASVSGVAGRLWSLSGDYAEFATPAEFMEFARPGTAKVAVCNSVLPDDTGSRILTETRVWCADAAAQLRFRPYWAVIGPFSRFIRSEILAAAVRRAGA